MSLLDDYVEQFNAGVRNGDWAPMIALLAPDAELEFAGIPVGPFAWAKDPARPAGELHLEERDGAIVRIRVLYEEFSG